MEIRIINSIWLLCCSYNPSKLQIASHIQKISNGIDAYCKKYENILIMGDFNVDVKEVSLHLFCNQYKLKSLNKNPTCYKNIDNPSCIDLLLTNSAKRFESTCTIEKDLSDFHKLVVTVTNEKHERMPLKVIQYRNYKKFDYAIFNNNLRKQTKNLSFSELDFATIRKIFMEIFEPLKNKYIRANHSKFVTKELSKAIMLRSKLRNQFLKTKTQESKMKYNKQRNLCVSITRKAKRSYYENLDLKDITDSKKFSATVKPLFSNKIKSTEYITLEENGKFISNDKELARIFNEFFVNIVPSLGINTNHSFLINTDNENDPIEKAIAKYKNHPSIISIKKFMENSDSSCSFKHVPKDKITKAIKMLDPKKVIQSKHIPTKLIKSFSSFFSDFIYTNLNKCIKDREYVEDFKKAEVRPLYKTDGRKEKSNYRPVSILSNVSIVYERCLIYDFFKNKFSKHQCRFRKGFNTKNAFLSMVEKMQLARDKKRDLWGILNDLSKAFDCISHDLLIAKLDVHGFNKNALNVIHNYLFRRSQKTKVGSSFSDLLDMLYGVPQGSTLGPLLFNINLCDLLLCEYSSEFSSFADDTTPYNCGKNYDEVISKVEDTIEKLFNWFQCNNFKTNASKCHFSLSPYQPVTIKIKESAIESSNSEKLLGVTIDSKLSFDDHITILCRKTSHKLHALSRVAIYMSFDKKRIFLKTFITSQFNYCPLVWMCHSKGLNNRINNLHERALRIVYQDKKSDFETLFKNDKSVTIHVRNLHYHVTEVYKVKNNISPEIMKEIFHFQENENYTLRSVPILLPET